MGCTSRIWRSLALVALLTAPLGVVVHVVGELISLGSAALVELTTSGRHDPLYALFALGTAGSILWTRTAGGLPGRRIRTLTAQLPAHGEGFIFFLLAFAAQVGWFAVTQAFEGDPIADGHFALGVLVAVLFALAAAFALALGKVPLLRLTVWICRFLDAPPPPCEPRLAGRPAVGSRRRIARYFSSHASRPPPSRFLTAS